MCFLLSLLSFIDPPDLIGPMVLMSELGNNSLGFRCVLRRGPARQAFLCQGKTRSGGGRQRLQATDLFLIDPLDGADSF